MHRTTLAIGAVLFLVGACICWKAYADPPLPVDPPRDLTGVPITGLRVTVYYASTAFGANSTGPASTTKPDICIIPSVCGTLISLNDQGYVDINNSKSDKRYMIPTASVVRMDIVSSEQ